MALNRGRDIDRLAVLGRPIAPNRVETLERQPNGIASRVACGADLVGGVRHQPLAQGFE